MKQATEQEFNNLVHKYSETEISEYSKNFVFKGVVSDGYTYFTAMNVLIAVFKIDSKEAKAIADKYWKDCI